MLTKLIIDRSRWLRGEGVKESFLLRPRDGRMCCLGQACVQAGLRPGEIANVKDTIEFGYGPHDRLVPVAPWLLPGGKLRLGQVMALNDSVDYSAEEREAKLTELFAAAGVVVTFVDSALWPPVGERSGA